VWTLPRNGLAPVMKCLISHNNDGT
jgi:hypothetical protein